MHSQEAAMAAPSMLGEIIGYRKDGRAIRLIGGGSEDEGHPNGPPPEGDVAGKQDPPDGGKTDELGENGKAALDKERAARREAEKRAKANEDAAKRLAEIEESNKTEQQKAIDRAEKAEREAAELRQQVLRRDVAAAKGIPAELADRLRGDDKESLEADADTLLALVKQPAPSKGAPQPPSGDDKSRAKNLSEALRQRMTPHS